MSLAQQQHVEQEDFAMKKARVLADKQREVINNPSPIATSKNKFADDDNVLDLNDIFESEMGENNAILKELFSPKEIDTKTDLTANQTKLIALLELKAKLIDLPELSYVVKKFEVLLISKDRKSRTEFVNSFRGIDETAKTSNMLTKFTGLFKNDK